MLPFVPRALSTQFIVFSDHYFTPPVGWRLVVVSPILPHDLPRSSRDPKIRPHLYLPDVTRSLYIDASVSLLGDPEELWRSLVPSPEVSIGVMRQTSRSNVSAEFDAVIDLSLDSSHRVEELRALYREEYPGELEREVLWGGIIARRHHDPSVTAAMETWLHMVLRYSRRDQLSLPFIMSTISAEKKFIAEIDNRKSKFHRWPHVRLLKSAEYFQEMFPSQERHSLEPNSRVKLLEHELDRVRGEERRLRRALHEIRTSKSWRAVRVVTTFLTKVRILRRMI